MILGGEGKLPNPRRKNFSGPAQAAEYLRQTATKPAE